MALSSLRLRRAVALSSSLIRARTFPSSPLPPSSYSSSPLPFTKPSIASSLLRHRDISRTQHLMRCFSYRSDSGEGKISPDEILFEGCDYNHWLITMDFPKDPKDPKPTPEQMVETYVETLAKVVGSKEEAMKRMYACSTTTYHGFQAVMTEEMSEKFRGLPGVVFILPDSYIDPVNKEYGGDKYEMGKITPRPPPVQYGRQGRYGDRNRNYDRPRYDRQSDTIASQQGNPPYGRQGPIQGSPQQNYNAMGQHGGPSYDNRATMQGGPSYDNRGPMQGGPSYDNRGPMQGGPSYDKWGPVQGGPSHDNRGAMQGGGMNYAPQQAYNTTGQQGDLPYGGQGPMQGGRGNHVAEARDTMPLYQKGFNQGEQGNFATQEQRSFSQGQQQGYRDTESFGGGNYRQGPSAGYGPNYTGPGQDQNFQHMENGTGGQQVPQNYGAPLPRQIGNE